MRKIKLIVTLVFLAGGTLIGFFAWMTNAIVAYPKWKMLQIEVIVEWFKEIEHLPPFHWFSSSDLVVVDLSTITTGLVLVTLAFATIGLLKALFGKLPEDRENFPFWSTYKAFYVELGLLGTLFGFILAFGETTLDDPEPILSALGTALWSTFSAIFLAFLVCPLIFENLLFRYLLNIGKNNATIDAGNTPIKEDIRQIAESFANLANEVNKTTSALGKLGEQMNNLESVQAALRELSLMRNELDSLKKDWEARYRELCNGRLHRFEQTLAKATQTVSNIENQLERVKIEIEEGKKTKGILSRIKDVLKE